MAPSCSSCARAGPTRAAPGRSRAAPSTATSPRVDGALREAEEELGLASARVEVVGSRTAVCGGWSYETVLARVRPDEELALRDRSESDGHVWVPWAEVGDLRLHPAFRTAWEHADDVLRTFVAS